MSYNAPIIFERPIKIGNKTAYEDVVLEQIPCPFCRKLMFMTDRILEHCGHGDTVIRYKIWCESCDHSFDKTDYNGDAFEEFYNKVKSTIKKLDENNYNTPPECDPMSWD